LPVKPENVDGVASLGRHFLQQRYNSGKRRESNVELSENSGKLRQNSVVSPW